MVIMEILVLVLLEKVVHLENQEKVLMDLFQSKFFTIENFGTGKEPELEPKPGEPMAYIGKGTNRFDLLKKKIKSWTFWHWRRT